MPQENMALMRDMRHDATAKRLSNQKKPERGLMFKGSDSFLRRSQNWRPPKSILGLSYQKESPQLTTTKPKAIAM